MRMSPHIKKSTVMNLSSTNAKRPPSDRGQGRKSLQADGAPSQVLQVRMTAEQKDKAKRLGGASWVRSMIDKAKEPKQAGEDHGVV